MKDTAKSVDEIIESIFPQIDWEEQVEDYDIMNF